MNEEIKEALADARYREFSSGKRLPLKASSTPKGVTPSDTTAPADTEPAGPPFCVVEYDTAGRVVYTLPARYEGDDL